MATYTTAWLVGSARDLDLDVLIGVSAQNVSGDLYLHHGTSTLSLLSQLAAAMTAAGVGGATAVITRDRRVKLASGGANFTVQWTDVLLRELLGFTGNLAAASSYTAPNISPLLWSPGKPMLPELSPLGCPGNTRPLAYYTASPNDGSTFVVTHGARTDQRWSVSHVALDRVQTPDELGGQWVRFFAEVAAKGYRFWFYPEAVEEPGSAVSATLESGLGPYVFTSTGRAPAWAFERSRGFEYLNRRANLSWSCRAVPEYD